VTPWHHNNVKSLLVDDDPTSLTMLESVMETLSLKYVSANNVRDAQSLLRQLHPRIAILDVQLPDGTG
jgi:DNA-binding response OmpR family regulator